MQNAKRDNDPKKILFHEGMMLITRILSGVIIWYSWFNTYQKSPTRDVFIILTIGTVTLILMIIMSIPMSATNFERSTGKSLFSFIKEMIEKKQASNS